MSVARRVALVTGANKGIGFELVRKLASSDPTLTVLMGARDPARGSASAAALGLSNVAPLALDVSSAASIKAAAAEVSRRYGKLDLLVCNAGVFLKDGRDVSGTAAGIDETLAPNYYGVRDCCSAFMPILNANGRVVNVSSGLARPAMEEMSKEHRAAFEKPDFTVAELDGLISSYRSACLSTGAVANGWPASVYGLSKAAVVALSRILGRDATNGVTVNAVCPGWCKTDMTGDMAPRTAVQGAEELFHVSTLPEGDRTNGQFFENKQPVKL